MVWAGILLFSEPCCKIWTGLDFLHMEWSCKKWIFKTYICKITCLHHRLILFRIIIRTLSKFLWWLHLTQIQKFISGSTVNCYRFDERDKNFPCFATQVLRFSSIFPFPYKRRPIQGDRKWKNSLTFDQNNFA